MRNIVAVSIAVLALAGACKSTGGAKGDRMGGVTIFYLAFSLETYRAVTVDLIEERASCRFVVAEESEVAQFLRSAFDGADSGSFDNRVVRVKAIGLGVDPMFVDQDGGLRRGKEERALQKSTLAALESMLEGMAKSEGCGGGA